MTIANRISAPTSAPMAYHFRDSMIFMLITVCIQFIMIGRHQFS
jgi:hypothetical protein